MERSARTVCAWLLGHPAMKLSPEINLIAVSTYLLALEYQR